MASSLDDTIPQWKKDLILRKRAGLGGTGGAGSRQGTDRTTFSSSSAGREERCDSDKQVNSGDSTTSNINMVQDSVLVMRPLAPQTTNGDCCRGDNPKAGSDSDSSEELQYGPGIVSKLKSKYLSLTLRETHTTSPRPSILPLRRAASMEQLLDAEEPPARLAPPVPRRYTPRIPAAGAVTAPSPRYRAQMRRNGTEQVKRARSVEAISRSQSEPAPPALVPAPGARRPQRPLRIAPVLEHSERPPADHVKQTLRLFEGPALRRTKPPPSTGDVAAKVASFKQIMQQHSPPPPPPPLPLSLKPTNLPPKPINIPPPSSPVKKAPAPEPSPIPDVLDSSAGKCPTPDLIVHSSPQIQMRPFSPKTLQDVTQNFIQSEITHSVHIHNKPASPTKSSPRAGVKSPVESSPKVASRSPSPRIPVEPPVDSKEISKQAVDNISKAGHTITYRFSDLSPKSHLPRLNSVPVRIKLVPENISSPPLKTSPSISSTPPSVSSPAVVSKPPQKALNGRTTSQPQRTPLTSQEIEKNCINKMKTREQPVSKVVVAMRSVDEVVAKKAKSPRSPQQDTTILFDFSARKSIPDYIATDGSQNVRRGKREKPKPGESGVILLPGAPAEEFADDDEDWMLSLNGPPSPCDVHFVNDNILIDGRSSISSKPKRQKLRIQFDDDATQVFEYLSEASALEDGVATTPPVTSPPPVAGHTVPSLTGSNLSNYTPSKMSTSDFQLGVTRQQQPAVVTSAPAAATPAPDSLDLLPVPAEHPVTYSAETTADILF